MHEQEVPTTSPETKPGGAITRRTLLDYILVVGGVGFLGSIFYPVLRYLNPPKQAEAVETSVKVGKVADFPKNSGKLFPFNNKPTLLVHTANGEFKAFDGVCTHLECTVQYKADVEHIWCACHNGHYDLAGRNIAGPPPKPLEEYQVNIQGEEIFVSKKT